MELDRCPFCGGRARVEPVGAWYETLKYKVRCLECLASSANYDSREEAIAAWNRRYCDEP